MKLKIADYFTFGNLVCGLLAIYVISIGNFNRAIFFILLGMLFDYIDGKIARIFRNETPFGGYIDSLADLVTFGIAPAFFVVTMFPNTLTQVIAVLFVCAGAYRLARFNVEKGKKIADYFDGMPITLNALLLALLFIFELPMLVYAGIFAISTVMMVTKIKIKKIY